MIRGMTLSRSGQFALISHELKVGASLFNRNEPTP
jgi:hypothetical protein